MAEGEPHTHPNPMSSVFQQVNRQGNFGWEQKEDERLKRCWAQVHQIEGVDQSLDQRLPSAYFLVRGCLLYQRTSHKMEIMDLLVVPKKRTQTLMHLAQAHPLGGHQRARNTLEKLKDRFVWLGMDAEFRGFCQQCPQCQRTAPRKPPLAPPSYHRHPLQDGQHGPHRAVPKICPGSRIHTGNHGLCHRAPRGGAAT